MSEALPCPWCQSSASVVSHRVDETHGGWVAYEVRCTVCGRTTGDVSRTEDDAVNAWNDSITSVYDIVEVDESGLAPCPVCKTNEHLIHSHGPSGSGREFYVHCSSCMTQGPSVKAPMGGSNAPHERAAEQAWNDKYRPSMYRRKENG